MKWSVSSQQLCRYIKNPCPAKAFALKGQFGVTSVPSKMASLLSHFWGAIESWPRGTDLDRILMDIENLFGMFLLFCQEQTQLTALVGMANSTPGPDGWSITELRALPMHALESLVEVVNSPSWNPSATLLSVFKRVPIEKTKGIPLVSEIRPIDIFSCLTRAISKAHTQDLTRWKSKVTHSSQHATHGGAIPAIARLSLYTELVLRKADLSIWALSIDCSKLYNMISPVVAAKIATMMGLQAESAQKLIHPIVTSRGYWRMPNSATCPPFRLGRGVPQGLSASVLWGEIFLGALIWKLHWAGATVIGYVDDLHVLSLQ